MVVIVIAVVWAARLVSRETKRRRSASPRARAHVFADGRQGAAHTRLPPTLQQPWIRWERCPPPLASKAVTQHIQDASDSEELRAPRESQRHASGDCPGRLFWRRRRPAPTPMHDMNSRERTVSISPGSSSTAPYTCACAGTRGAGRPKRLGPRHAPMPCRAHPICPIS